MFTTIQKSVRYIKFNFQATPSRFLLYKYTSNTTDRIQMLKGIDKLIYNNLEIQNKA